MTDKQIDEALEALEVLHYAKGEKFHKNVDRIRQALERQRVPAGCGWCDGPGPLNAEGLCVKCLYPDGPPKGWQLVPVHITEVMQEAVARNKLERLKAGPKHSPGAITAIIDDWNCALAAAPKPDEG